MKYKDNFETITMFHITPSDENIPQEARDEIGKLWTEGGLDSYSPYFYWESKDQKDNYPITDSFLNAFDTTKCIIRYWW